MDELHAVGDAEFDSAGVLGDGVVCDIEPIFASLHGQPVPFVVPEEVTHAVLFLAAEANAHITGTVISVDAGAAARFTT